MLSNIQLHLLKLFCREFYRILIDGFSLQPIFRDDVMIQPLDLGGNFMALGLRSLKRPRSHRVNPFTADIFDVIVEKLTWRSVFSLNRKRSYLRSKEKNTPPHRIFHQHDRYIVIGSEMANATSQLESIPLNSLSSRMGHQCPRQAKLTNLIIFQTT